MFIHFQKKIKNKRVTDDTCFLLFFSIEIYTIIFFGKT